jgi:hypothetical protein
MRKIVIASILVLLISGLASANGLSEALDTSLNVTTNGEGKWFSQTDMAFFVGDAADAAQSPDIEDDEASWMLTTVYGPGTTSFYWKVSSEAKEDFLEFYIDGVLQDKISGLVDWQQKVYTITEHGKHTLEWRYAKDESNERNDDCAWVDLVEWSGSPLVTLLSEALDTNLNLTTGGKAKWVSQEDIACFDGDAARSGNVGDDQESFLQMTAEGAGILSFYWKVCSEAGFDFLEFYIDGVLQDQINGFVDWHQMVYTIIEPGTHTLEWRYIKDDSNNRDDDCGWLDLVQWSVGTQSPLITPLSKALETSVNVTTNSEAQWFPQMDMAFFDGDAYDAAKSADIDNGQMSCMQTTIEGSGTLSFYWKVCSEAGFDFLEFYIDGVLKDKISGVKDWQQKVYTIDEPGTHTLEWRYVKDNSVDTDEDCAWVDLMEWWSPTQPPAVTPLSEALDTSLNVTTNGEGRWLSQTNTAFFDSDAARSANIEDDEASWMQTTIEGSGTLSFYWKVCSEAGCDFLEFYIDGVRQDKISGLVDWNQMVYTIDEPGKHTLEWRYVKDKSVDTNEDCAWVDLVQWSG